MTSENFAKLYELPIAHRLALVESLWDSIEVEASDLNVPDWHKTLLDQRLQMPDQAQGLEWSDLKARLLS